MMKKGIAGMLAFVLAACAVPSGAFALAQSPAGATPAAYAPLDANERAKLGAAGNTSPSLPKKKAGTECHWWSDGSGFCSDSSSSGGEWTWKGVIVAVAVGTGVILGLDYLARH